MIVIIVVTLISSLLPSLSYLLSKYFVINSVYAWILNTLVIDIHITVHINIQINIYINKCTSIYVTELYTYIIINSVYAWIFAESSYYMEISHNAKSSHLDWAYIKVYIYKHIYIYIYIYMYMYIYTHLFDNYLYAYIMYILYMEISHYAKSSHSHRTYIKVYTYI
jgi:hypothetical protein